MDCIVDLKVWHAEARQAENERLREALEAMVHAKHDDPLWHLPASTILDRLYATVHTAPPHSLPDVR